MGDQYGFADLRQMIAAAPRFPVEEDRQDHHFRHAHDGRDHLQQHHHHQQHYHEMLMLGNVDDHHHQVPTASDQVMAPPPPHRSSSSSSNSCGLMLDVFCANSAGNNSTTTLHNNNAAANITSLCGSGGGSGSLEMEAAGAGQVVGGGHFMMSTSGAGGCDGNGGGSGGGGGNSRWPRQETLTLLEIRSRLDSKFKEANQKGPLWDEVSRIMGEEHGYQRSGKKCREKFENLYKYYKKTKEGKAGRQDGKHYRFFRQLEALYGTHDHDQTTITNPLLAVSSLSELANVAALGTTININGEHDHQFHQNTIANHHHQQQSGLVLMQPAAAQSSRLSESLSFSNSSEFDTSSSEDNGDINIDDHHLTGAATIGNFMENDDDSIMEKLKRKCLEGDVDDDNRRSTSLIKSRGRKSWKAKIRDFVDKRMKKLMETQEAWLERMLKTLEHKEQERMAREEEWRKQESARIDREHKYWRAQERAWFETRDATLMNALQRFIGRQTDVNVASPLHDDEEFMAATTEHQENSTDQNHNENGSSTVKCSTSARWSEVEISSLLQLRSSLDTRFQQMMSTGSCSEGTLWEEVAANMGYQRSARSCQEKWESINNHYRRDTNNGDEYSYNNNKKRRENISSRGVGPYSQLLIGTAYDHHQHGEAGFVVAVDGTLEDQGPEVVRIQLNDGPSPSNSNAGTSGNNDNNCLRFLMNGGENNLWENNYGMNKLEKGGN